MLVLDSTTKSIVATMSGTANTTNPSFVTAYSDNTGTVFTEGSSDGALNGISSVTLVAAPASSTRRLIKTIYISNIDTAAVTVTISYNDNSTLRQIAKVTLQVGDTWSTDGTTDNTGSLKTTAGSVNLSNVTGTLTANGIVYASSTSVLTTGSALVFNGTNLGIGTSSPATKLSFGSYIPSDGQTVHVYQNSTVRSGLGVVSGSYRIFTNTTSAISFGQVSESDGSTYTERMRLDSSSNLGLGVTPSAWQSGLRALQVGANASLYGNGSNTAFFGLNFYTDSGSTNRYLTSNIASVYGQNSGQHQWFTAPSGTAGNPITFTQAMTLDASGNLGVGTTSTSVAKLNLGSGSGNNAISLDSWAITKYVGAEIQWGGVNASNWTTATFYTNGSERARIPAAGGFQSVGSISVGNATPSTSGAGITFPATQSASSDANTLDDYEEGTFTPTLIVDSGTPSYQYQEGRYTKIGNYVYGGGIIGITNSNTLTGGIRIQLPFTSINSSYGMSAGIGTDGSGITWPVTGTGGYSIYYVCLQAQPNTVTLAWYVPSTTSTNPTYTSSGIASTWYFRFNFAYFTPT